MTNGWPDYLSWGTECQCAECMAPEEDDEMLVVHWLRNQARYLRDLDSGSDDAVQIEEAADTIERQYRELAAWRDRFPMCEFDSASGSIDTNRPPV
jgi:uncharacterized protein YfdQ (DUF2303 family)